MFNRESSARHEIRFILATVTLAGTICLGRASAGDSHYVRVGLYIINLDQLDYEASFVLTTSRFNSGAELVRGKAFGKLLGEHPTRFYYARMPKSNGPRAGS
jgi:hypothetical protein